MAAMRVAVILSCLVALAYAYDEKTAFVCIRNPNLLQQDLQALEFVDQMRLSGEVTSTNMTYDVVQGYVKKLSSNVLALGKLGSATVIGDYLSAIEYTVASSNKLVLKERNKLQGDINKIHTGGMSITQRLANLLKKLKGNPGYKKLNAGQQKMLNLIFNSGGGIQLMNEIRPDIMSLKVEGKEMEAKKLINNLLVKGGVAQYFRGLQKKLQIKDDRNKKLGIGKYIYSLVKLLARHIIKGGDDYY